MRVDLFNIAWLIIAVILLTLSPIMVACGETRWINRGINHGWAPVKYVCDTLKVPK